MMWNCIPTAKTADNTSHSMNTTTTTTMDLTPQQLVERKVAEIKRRASIEPCPAYVQGALMATLEALIEIFPQVRQHMEQSISFSEIQPTPTR